MTATQNRTDRSSRDSKPKGAPKKSFIPDIAFTSITMGKQELEAWESWDGEVEPDVPWVLECLMGEGFKVSITHDMEHDTLIATATETRVRDTAVYHSFSARHPSVREALSLLWFKWTYVAKSSFESVAPRADWKVG